MDVHPNDSNMKQPVHKSDLIDKKETKRQPEHAGGSGDVAATNSEAVCRIGHRDGYDEGDQHYAGNRSRSKNQQIERGPICVPDHVRKLTGWEDVAAAALAARSAEKNLCPQSLPAQKGEKARFCSSESRRGVQDRSALPGR